MKTSSHLFGAVCVAPIVYMMVNGITKSTSSASIAACAVVFGGKAPDYLELPLWFLGKRFSLLAHRTITHTWWLWVVFIGMGYHMKTCWDFIFLGYGIGAIVHILQDWTTPMGIPVVNPYGKRMSLGLSRNYFQELLLCGILAASMGLVFWINWGK